jgi:hypothetical protein
MSGASDIYRNRASLGAMTDLSRHLYMKTLTPTADAFLYNEFHDTNYSNNVHNVITPYTATLRYPVIRFDLAAFPVPFTVQAAILRLYAATIGGAGRYIGCYRLLRTDWVESQVTFHNYKTGSTWTTAGALGAETDFTNTGWAIATVPAATNWMTFDVTQQVQAMFTGAISTANFLLRDLGTTAALDNSFEDKEDVDSSKWPRLVIAGYQ